MQRLTVHSPVEGFPRFQGGQVHVFGQRVSAKSILSAEKWTRPRPVNGYESTLWAARLVVSGRGEARVQLPGRLMPVPRIGNGQGAREVLRDRSRRLPQRCAFVRRATARRSGSRPAAVAGCETQRVGPWWSACAEGPDTRPERRCRGTALPRWQRAAKPCLAATPRRLPPCAAGSRICAAGAGADGGRPPRSGAGPDRKAACTSKPRWLRFPFRRHKEIRPWQYAWQSTDSAALAA